MYDVRGTRYDVLVSAHCAGDAERERSRISEATDGFNRDAAVRFAVPIQWLLFRHGKR